MSESRSGQLQGNCPYIARILVSEPWGLEYTVETDSESLKDLHVSDKLQVFFSAD